MLVPRLSHGRLRTRVGQQAGRMKSSVPHQGSQIWQREVPLFLAAGTVGGVACGVILKDSRDPANAFVEAQRAALPKRLFLVRHGESEANADHTLWREKADNLISLTEKGHEQAREAGQRIRKIIGDETVGFCVSPFSRTLQTLRGIRKAFRDRVEFMEPARSRKGGAKEGWVYIDTELREQEMGSNIQNLQGEEANECRRVQREVVGRFFYRFPAGESGADVYQRTKQWLLTTFININLEHGCTPVDNVVVVTHGLTMRFILMAISQWSVNTFESVWNADNCAVWVLEKDLSKKGHLPYTLRVLDGSNGVKSSRNVGVTFKDGSPPKIFQVSDYLSITPPRSRQFDQVKRMIAEQHKVDIENIDRLDFYAPSPGSLQAFGHGQEAGKLPGKKS